MPIEFTKFGSAQFDVDSFDYNYTDTDFATDVVQDFDNIMLESGDVFNVTEISTEQDGMGVTKNITEETFRIYGYIKDITKKDLKIHDMGLATPGNRVLYTKPVYTITSGGTETEYTVGVGDVLIDRDNTEWRVERLVHEAYAQDQKVYKKFVVRNLNL